jgi:60 kDa SS-A/Ro ribonucleoprotein
MEALLRNLNKLSQIGILDQGNFDEVKYVCNKLMDEESLKKERLHPLKILLGANQYSRGHGMRGSLTWTVNKKVVDALDEAFYKAFKFVEPTGKRFYLGLDVSASMTSPMNNLPISCRDASGALAMVTMRTEENYIVKGFTGGGTRISSNLTDLQISPKMNLREVLGKISGLPFGGTDCSLPMLDAIKNNYKVDAFVIYTDNETWAGNVHPIEALKQYRQKSGIDAKLIVVGMTSTGFSIADPNDRGCLDVVGFDTSTPDVISGFAAGRI